MTVVFRLTLEPFQLGKILMKASQKLLSFFPIKNEEWRETLLDYLEPNQATCQKILDHTKEHKDKLLPSPDKVFEALRFKGPNEIRAVIIGQDPYPTPGNSHGLCFSVEHGVPPASLKNIFTEIQRDFGGSRRTNANLLDWAQQGVLLLNSSLTVLPKQANCHSKIGWDVITGMIARLVWVESPDSAFMLWGNNAKKLVAPLLKNDSDRIFACGHPSPLAYGRKGMNNFKGCGHFKKVNQFLISRGHLPIVWHKRDTLLDFIIQ